MSLKSFLISKTFFKHVAFLFLSVIALLFVVIKGLDIYTDNGEFILIPKLENMDADSLLVHSDAHYLQFVVIDSIYSNDKIPGAVVTQHPKVGARVKKGRKVYLSIVAKTPEIVNMPNLKDLSIRRAVDVIRYAHLKIEKVEFVDDIALNAVIEQLYNGDTIAPDSLLPSGSYITLLVGNGFNKAGASVPFLLGKTARQAQEIILKSSFNLGRIDTLDENFDEQWRVYEQRPFVDFNEKNTFPFGTRISIKMRSSLGFNFDSLVNLYNLPDSLRFDSLQMKDEMIEF